jgi:hypothetical protein
MGVLLKNKWTMDSAYDVLSRDVKLLVGIPKIVQEQEVK